MARVRERPLRALGAIRFVFTAARHLSERGPFDRVITHWLVPSAWPIALVSEAPLEVVCHGSDVRLLERLPRLAARRIVAGLLQRGARFRFVSSDLRERLAKATYPEVGIVSRVEPSPIDLSRAPSRQTARERLQIEPDTLLALVVGRLVPAKRADVALAAATLLPAEVVVIGDGPERSPLERRFPSAHFVGQVPRDEALAWMAAADVLVTASRHEGASTVIREARALGVPVVTAPAGDVVAWAARDPEISVVA
jgi:glycosyltransferase involved in cell wall biosynthesis